jgi:hypothetical protein
MMSLKVRLPATYLRGDFEPAFRWHWRARIARDFENPAEPMGALAILASIQLALRRTCQCVDCQPSKPRLHLSMMSGCKIG